MGFTGFYPRPFPAAAQQKPGVALDPTFNANFNEESICESNSSEYLGNYPVFSILAEHLRLKSCQRFLICVFRGRHNHCILRGYDGGFLGYPCMNVD